MRRFRLPARAVCVGGILIVLLGVASAAARQPAREELQQRIDSAIKLYREGEYEKAATVLEQVLKLDPTSKEALFLREKVGLGMLVEMLKDPRFEQAAREILSRSSKEADDVRRDPDTLKKVVDELGSEDFATRCRAINHCVAAGPFAVPYLLDWALGDEPASLVSRRSASLIALRRMGSAGIPPMVAAFQSADDSAAANIAGLIAHNPDARAVPALVAVADDETRPEFLRNAAVKTLDKIFSSPPTAASAWKTSKAPAPSLFSGAGEACAALAKRYYYQDPLLIDLTPARDRVIWEWRAAGATFAERLGPKNVPGYAYARLLAEDLLLDAMKQKNPGPHTLELFICNNYMQLDEALAADDGRAGQLQRIHGINESIGAKWLYLALERALTDGETVLARRCVEALRNVGDGRRPPVPNSLVKALTYPDKFVRVAAAETLMRLSPEGRLGDPEEVAYVLSAGLGVPVAESVAVLTTDHGLGKELSESLRAWHLLPETYRKASVLLERAKRRIPPLNAVIIDARARAAKAPVLAGSIREDARSAGTVVIVLAAKEKAAKLRQACGRNAAAVLAVPYDAEALRTALQSAFAASAEVAAYRDVRDNAKLLRRILNTTISLPTGTRYPAHLLAKATPALFTGYPEDIRILALNVIEAFPQPGLRDKTYGIFADGGQPATIRREAGDAFFRCLLLAPTLQDDQIAQLRRMTRSEEAPIRVQATHALAIASIPQAKRQAALLDALRPAAPQTP